ncbi:ATPase [Loktanella sp. SALINAS62]|nr:ATPase [Loktanella sp. SALINAS62]
MICLEGLTATTVLWAVIGISAVAAIVLFWMMKFQSFQGKIYYAITFLAMIWTLIMVGFEASSATFACQLQWATLAWLGNGVVPVAWCFFVFAYVDNAYWQHKASIVLAIVPLAMFAFVATNSWHNLVYTNSTTIPAGQIYIDYAHGPAFFAIIGTLYAFVLATLYCLGRAFCQAKRAAWPLLTMLVIITTTPLAANAAYVGFGFTVFGLDPTPFMFTLALLPFTWMLVTNKTMDMASVGQSTLFNTMSEPVVLIDRHRKIVLMNTAAKRSGREHGIKYFLNAMRASIDKLNTSEGVANMTIGAQVYEPRVQEIANPLDPSGSTLGWSVTFVDITDRVVITLALEEALKKADDASRAKDEFISVVSHELRTPLTSLKGGLALALSGRLGELAGPIRSSLEIANRNGIRLSRLVDNILLAQKIDIEALSLESSPVDLGNLLEESIEENKMFASERDVRLVTSTVEKSAFIMGDAFAIRQIVDNLISNAIKFSKEHEIVEGALNVHNGRVRLSIKDSGCGIPDGMEDRVFGRFEQVENSAQGSTQGSGLGLHISKQLAEQLSGELFYESRVGVGTTFHIEFWLVDRVSHEAAEPAFCALASAKQVAG